MIVETEEIDWFICFIRFLTYSMLIMTVAVVIIIFAIVTNAMGGGDVKYIFCSMLFLVPEREVSVLILWFLIMFTLMLIYSIVIQYMNPDKRKNGIPMIPFISGAGIIMVIISDFILKL